MCTEARAVVTLSLALALAACKPEPPVPGRADYAALALPAQCAPGSRDGAAGLTDTLQTSRRVPYAVRTPANYDATRAHPLLMVFAPAGFDRSATERHARFTEVATAAGFVVAYADHLPLSYRAFDALAEVPALVAAHWCIDTTRVSFAGHSDGATTALALGFLRKGTVPPAALIASAAGIRGEDLARERCPASVATLVIHSREDDHFPPPAYGRDAARWWAACNRCTGEGAVDAGGCFEFRGCAAPTRFCETTGPHARWPAALGDAVLQFAASARAGR